MKKIILIGCILSFTILFTSCSKEQENIMNYSEEIKLEQKESVDKEGSVDKEHIMKTYNSPNGEYAIELPEEWVKGNEPIFDEDNNLNISIEQGEVDVSVGVSDLPSEEVEETLEWYKGKGGIDEYKTRQGYNVSIVQYADFNSSNFYGLICENEKMYTFYCSPTPEFYNKNEELLIQIVKSLNVLSYHDNTAEEVKGIGGTEDDGEAYEKVDREILEKYREIEQSDQEMKIIDLRRMENERINLQLYEIMDFEEENMYLNQESPLSVSKMILYGLTIQPVVLEATVYDKEKTLSILEEAIPEFQGTIAENYDNFRLSMHGANEYNNEYLVYVNLDEEDCDMQFLMEFRKINGNYYFEKFKSI